MIKLCEEVANRKDIDNVKRLKTKTILMILILLLILTGIVHSGDFISLDEIEPGMRGRAKTVFAGVEVETFSVEVVDITENDLGNDLILINSDDEKINKIGGIAAGMSGSPVYFDDRLAGAIAYSWSNIEDNYALVTPIERMKKLLADIKKEDLSKKEELDLLKLTTPLLVSGVRGRALDNLKRELSSFDIKRTAGGQAEIENIENVTLEPGSAVAVQLVRGDVNIFSIGTLTYIDNNKFAAFGHYFTHKGPVDFLFSQAYINTIISSPEYPFKLGYPFDRLEGVVNVDREAGIAGRTDRYSAIIPLRINIIDQDRNIEENVFVQMVKDEDLLTSLGVNVALQAVDNTIDRIGKGTAEITLEALGKELPDLRISRSNIFYSSRDIAARSLIEFQEFLDLLVFNPFKKVDLVGLNLDIEITSKEKSALIQKAEIINDDIKPGETMRIKLYLQPYRAEVIEKVVEVEIPEDFRPGRASILIESGYNYFDDPIPVTDPEEEETDMTKAEFEGYTDLESMILDFLEEKKNNEIILKGTVQRDYREYEGEDNNNQKTEEEKIEEFKKVKCTDYVVEGRLNLEIDINENNKGNQLERNNNDKNKNP